MCGLKHYVITCFWHCLLSHPSWVCGLKHSLRAASFARSSHTLRGCVDWNCKLIDLRKAAKSHTLRGCVDWNLDKMCVHFAYWASHPSWVCGLKPPAICPAKEQETSHPSWVCGLKHREPEKGENNTCHTLRGCVDWNPEDDDDARGIRRHTLRGCVDWNNLCITKSNVLWRHTLRGCVDWNYRW